MERARIEALGNTPMFGGIDAEAIGFLVARGETVDVAAGGFFFRESDPGTAAYLLERGQATVTKRLRGREQVLTRLSVGDCFGEVALLDSGPRSASVLAVTDASALRIGARDLAELAGHDTEQFALIYMNLARELGRRLRDADARLFEVAHDEQAEAARGYEFHLI